MRTDTQHTLLILASVGVGFLLVRWAVRSAILSPPEQLPSAPYVPKLADSPVFQWASNVPTDTAHLSDDFFRGLLDMVADFQSKGAKASAEDFLNVWLAESKMDPTAKNAQGFAGLNQMGGDWRKRFGFTGTADDYSKLPAEAQLPYIKQYYEVNAAPYGFQVMSGVGKLYLMNAAPSKVGLADSQVLATKSPEDDGTKAWADAHTENYYAHNRGLDWRGKGFITVQDLGEIALGAKQQYAKLWDELKGRLNAVRSAPVMVATT